MALIKAEKGLGKTINLVILNVNDSPITPGANDKIRVAIGREGRMGVNFADAQFFVESGTDTAAGSSLTKGATNVLRIDASDLDFAAGIYSLFFDFFDNADAQEWKRVDRQCFYLENV